MRKYMSILMMCARQSVYKLLAVLAVMCVWEWMWFCEIVKGRPVLSAIYHNWKVWGILVLAWFAFTIILSIYGCRVKAGSPSLFRRLQVSRGKVFWLQVAYNFMSYVVLLNVQLVLFWVMGLQYCTMFPEECGPQTLFLAFGRDSYHIYPSALVMVSPLVDVFGWIWRFLSIAVFSLATASIMSRILAVGDDE